MNPNLFVMRILLLLFIVFLSLTESLFAQSSKISNKTALGIQLNQYQRDFGMGFNLTSPWFANQKIAIRTKGNIMFHEHLFDAETTWSPYVNATLGVSGNTGSVGNFIRLYGEGGVIGLFPSDEFSSESFEFGGYGLFGFEFFMSPRSNYFIEIGAAGTGAKADELPNNPIYSNGMMISTGFRFHLFNSASTNTNNSLQSNFKRMSKSDQSIYNRHKPVILGMGGGVLLGMVMGSLLDDPALGMAFGISVGGGYWYMLENEEKK